MHRMFRVAALAAIVLFAGAGTLSAQCLTDWLYRAPVTIDNSGGSALTNYQIKIVMNTADLVTAGKMNSDGSDIRFYQSDCCTLIDYWIEGGMNTASTTIWVEVPSIAAATTETIYLVYGNTGATAASSGDATFQIFDDFNGSSLDGTKWTMYTTGGTTSFSGSAITLESNYERVIRSNASVTPPVYSEMKVDASSGYWPNIAQLRTSEQNGHTLFAGGSTMYLGHTDASCTAYQAWLEQGTGLGSNVGIWSLLWTSGSSQSGTWPGGSLSNSNSNYSLGDVNIALGGLCAGGGSLTADWVRVRAYAAVEPSTSVGIEESFAPVITDNPDDAIRCTSESVSFSVAADGYALTYQWRKDGVNLADGGNVSGAQTATLTLTNLTTADNGSYDVVVSGCGGSVTSTAATLLVHAPPTIAVTVDPSSLWPPDHTMQTITADVDVTGNCTPLTVELMSVSSDEPDDANGNGDGATVNDIQGVGTGLDAVNDFSFDVRAERAGAGNGRTYTATYRVTDAAGNYAEASATIFVAHDQGNLKPAIVTGMQGRLALEQNAPNPFSSTTEIRYWTGEPTTVSLKVYSIDGREIATLVDGAIAAGDHAATWDGRDASGTEAAPGIYLYRLEAFGQVQQQRMVLSR